MEHERMTGLSLIFLLSFVFWLKPEHRSRLDTCARFKLAAQDCVWRHPKTICVLCILSLALWTLRFHTGETKEHCSWGLLRETARFPEDVAPGERK